MYEELSTQLRFKHALNAWVTRVLFGNRTFAIDNPHSQQSRMGCPLALRVRKGLLSYCCQSNLMGVQLHDAIYKAAK